MTIPLMNLMLCSELDLNWSLFSSCSCSFMGRPLLVKHLCAWGRLLLLHRSGARWSRRWPGSSGAAPKLPGNGRNASCVFQQGCRRGLKLQQFQHEVFLLEQNSVEIRSSSSLTSTEDMSMLPPSPGCLHCRPT